MDFKTELKIYLNGFYLLGFSPYQTSDEPDLSRKSLRCIKYAQVIICEAICMYVLTFFGDHYVVAETTLIQIYLLCDMMRAVFICVQCICYKHCMADIINSIQKLNTSFYRQFNHRITYENFKRNYNMKVFSMFGIYSVYLIGYLARYFLNQRAPLPVTMLKYLQLMTAMTYLHTIFYIDILSFHFSELNSIIQNYILQNHNVTFVRPNEIEKILNELKSFKIIHFEIWELTQMINRYFGWSTITLCLHAFSDLVYSAYWMFKEIQAYDGTFTIWSMSLIDPKRMMHLLIEIIFPFV